ncbi:MAG TPA: molybdopterin cofactor-binding domain-containing protein, partial [Acidobacteriota bacterium]|nr:molybdopterin cofactor-binding domain-containing protein [Acidobacteriota bacterium]
MTPNEIDSREFGESSDPMDRREFLKLIGPGLFIFFSIEDSFLLAQARGYPEDFNAYLKIGEDGRVTCFTGKIEMGQGIVASLAQMLAEELEVPYNSVTMVTGDTRLCPWDGGTNGSRSIKYFGPALRAAGAEAREVLIQLAALQLRLPQDRLVAKDGRVSDKSDPRKSVSYGALTKGNTIEKHLEKKPALKPPSAFTVCGKSLPRPDASEKVTGKAQFAGDIRLPGMLYGRVLRPPAHGAKLKNVDVSGAKEINDVRVVQEGEFVAVLHSLPDQADKAMARIKAQFELPEAVADEKTIHKRLMETAGRDNVIENKGDLSQGRELATVKFDEIYYTPYVAHAPMETHTAVAQVESDSATLWISTQRPFGAQEEVAKVLGLPASKVRVIAPYVGGGFGGKSQIGQAVQAARLSKIVGRPVLVAWTREEEFFYDTFMPAAAVKISSGLNASNQIVFWDYQVLFAGERSSQNIYNVPHLRTASRGGFSGGGPHPFGTGAWRGPGSNTNIFARESHIDVMAAKAGMDPVEFRMRNLADKRMIRVLRAAVDKFGWKPAKAPSGRGYGVACLDYLGTYVAMAAEIKVDKGGGRIQVNRIVHAQDMGPVINPEGAR